MAVDTELQELLHQEIHAVEQSCAQRCEGVHSQLGTHQRQLDQVAVHLDSDREVVRNRLDNIKETLVRLCEIVEGPGNLATRVAVLEKLIIPNGQARLGSLEQYMEQVRKALDELLRFRDQILPLMSELVENTRERRRTWREILAQSSPFIVTVVGAGVLYFLYLLFAHGIGIPAVK